MSLSINDHLSETGLRNWTSALSVSDDAHRREGIRTTLAFLASEMPLIGAEDACNFLRCMDLSRSVRWLTLTPGERLIAFRRGNESQFKLFYTRPGASVHQLGVNPAGRACVHYRVRGAAAALESYASGAIDSWSVPDEGQQLSLALHANSVGYMASGGHVQIMVPRSYQWLQVEPVGATFAGL